MYWTRLMDIILLKINWEYTHGVSSGFFQGSTIGPRGVNNGSYIALSPYKGGIHMSAGRARDN